jgi:hypothetical protein
MHAYFEQMVKHIFENWTVPEYSHVVRVLFLVEVVQYNVYRGLTFVSNLTSGNKQHKSFEVENVDVNIGGPIF